MPHLSRIGNCALQTLAFDLNIIGNPYETKLPEETWDRTFRLSEREQVH